MTTSRTSRSSRTKRQTRIRVAAAIATVAVILATTAAGCGSSDGVVGGSCANLYTQCALTCVDLQTDPKNCGACGNVCAPGVACVGGECANEIEDANVDAPFDYDGTVYEDGQYCDLSDPAHPVCRPGPDSSTDGSRDGTDDGTLDATGDGNLDATGDGNLDAMGDGNDLDGTLDGKSSLDGSVDGDSSSNSGDGSSEDGSFEDGESPDANEDAQVPDAAPFDACVPPYNRANACGACGISCSGATPLCSLVDGGYECVPLCTLPLTDCVNSCVDLSRDPFNCGKCGNVCPSQYCYLGTCQGSTAGVIIALGHDFAGSGANDEETHLLYNSVFFNSTTVRLLSYEHYVTASAVANAKSLLTSFAATNHDTLTITTTNSDTYIPTTLSTKNTDVVVIWDQTTAPSGTLGSLGTSWAAALSEFTQGGGVVIVVDAATGIAQMPALETNAALLAVTGHAALTSATPATVVTDGETLVHGMLTVYLTEGNSAWFSTSEAASATTVFATYVSGQPTHLLAVQKIVQ